MFVCFIPGQMIRNRENHFARNSRTDDIDHLRIVYRHRFDPPNGLTISRKRREHHPSLSNSRRGPGLGLRFKGTVFTTITCLSCSSIL